MRALRVGLSELGRLHNLATTKCLTIWFRRPIALTFYTTAFLSFSHQYSLFCLPVLRSKISCRLGSPEQSPAYFFTLKELNKVTAETIFIFSQPNFIRVSQCGYYPVNKPFSPMASLHQYMANILPVNNNWFMWCINSSPFLSS